MNKKHEHTLERMLNDTKAPESRFLRALLNVSPIGMIFLSPYLFFLMYHIVDYFTCVGSFCQISIIYVAFPWIILPMYIQNIFPNIDLGSMGDMVSYLIFFMCISLNIILLYRYGKILQK